MASRPLLTVRDLSVGRAGRAVARGLDFELHRGELVAVLGPNGAGKSTLLATLAGLIAPVDGSVEREGRVAAALQAPALARRSVVANLEAALGWWGVPRADRTSRARAALEQLAAGALADRRADTLSGGEARRVHLARALALQADVLLLDEPFAGLDVPTRAGLLRDAAAALRDPERTTLVVVHDRAEAWALADRLIVILDGEQAACGPLRTVLETPPTHAVAAFLGFTGELRQDGQLLCLRPSHVSFDPAGALEATVERVLPEEDGVLCDLTLATGRVQARHPHPSPDPGARVRLRIDGGVRFEA